MTVHAKAAVVVMVAALLGAPLVALAQETPRTAWGAPDLNGVWDFRTLTPFERPEELAEREFFTEEEAAAFEANRAGRARGPRRPGAGRHRRQLQPVLVRPWRDGQRHQPDVDRHRSVERGGSPRSRPSRKRKPMRWPRTARGSTATRRPTAASSTTSAAGSMPSAASSGSTPDRR